MISVYLYNVSEDPKSLVKTLGTVILSGYADLYDDSSVVDPVLKLAWNSNAVHANYLYIPEFDRYYFIKNITAATGGAMLISGHCDVLGTYGAKIKELSAVLVRSSRLDYDGRYRSTYVDDPKLPIHPRKTLKVVEFSSPDINIDTASATSYNFVLNVAGGGSVSSSS